MKQKKSRILLIVSCIVLLLVAVILGAIIFIKSSIVGTYLIKSIKGEYKGITVSAEYEDDSWKVEESTNLLSGLIDLDSLLKNYDNSIATLTINSDFSYFVDIGNIDISVENLSKEKEVLDKKNWKFTKEGITFEQENYKVVFKGKTITIKGDSSEIVFEKEK